MKINKRKTTFSQEGKPNWEKKYNAVFASAWSWSLWPISPELNTHSRISCGLWSCLWTVPGGSEGEKNLTHSQIHLCPTTRDKSEYTWGNLMGRYCEDQEFSSQCERGECVYVQKRSCELLVLRVRIKSVTKQKWRQKLQKNNLWSITSYDAGQNRKKTANVGKHAYLLDFTDQWFPGKMKPLLL